MGAKIGKKITATAIEPISFELNNLSELDDYLTKKIAHDCKFPIPGLSMAIISKHHGIHFYNYGYQDLLTKMPTSSQSIYHLFSGTKVFTATAILQLLQQKRINSLSDTVGKYLSNDYIAKYTADVGSREIYNNHLTIEHLLTHTSGIKDKVKHIMQLHYPCTEQEKNALLSLINEKDGETENSDIFKDWTLKALENYGKIRISKRRIGKNLEYCNFNYCLLGEIIANANENEWKYEKYMEEMIFKPLNMNVSFSFTEEMFGNNTIVTGYIYRYSPIRLLLRWYVLGKQIYRRLLKHQISDSIEMKTHDANDSLENTSIVKSFKVCGLNEFELDSVSIGGLLCSTEEIAKFLQWQMKIGNSDQNILDDEYLNMMQDNQKVGGIGLESRYAMGYGWKIGLTDDQRRFINHEGGGPGFHSELRIYTEHDLAIAIFASYSPLNPQGIATFMHELCECVYQSLDMIDRELAEANEKDLIFGK